MRKSHKEKNVSPTIPPVETFLREAGVVRINGNGTVDVQVTLNLEWHDFGGIIQAALVNRRTVLDTIRHCFANQLDPFVWANDKFKWNFDPMTATD